MMRWWLFAQGSILSELT